MRLLIAYDGSKCADSALDDLKHAGLATEGEATDYDRSRSMAASAAAFSV